MGMEVGGRIKGEMGNKGGIIQDARLQLRIEVK